ncbi:MAG TPA: N4-gp56 family major capsid protein [Rhodocyclaceae bacterium]|nr:N4-gp56 family major capsid protein [Rhodocyclaceae bacterium]
MSYTNFALLTNEQKTVWSMDLWKQARNMSFVNQFLGKDSNSMIQHVTELKKSEKGARAVITLLTDLEGDGIAGDRTLEGNEEAMKSFDQVIRIDQLRHANRHEGRMADQKSVVNFREESRDKLAYWLGDRVDQLAFLTMSGVGYTVKNSGGTRVGSDLPYLEFAADVTAPSSKRFGRWNGTSKLIEWGTGNGSIAAADTPMWELFVQAKAYAKDHYIRGILGKGGEETYHCFLGPQAMARLKLDPTYMQNLRYAQNRGDDNALFSGSSVKIDGIYFHEFRHVVNTRLAASGSKWGAGGAVDGCQVLFCGAQALGMADIGNPEWVEKGFDYENQQGISTGKILGFKKPQFYSQYSGGTTEDFGVISLYVAQ